MGSSGSVDMLLGWMVTRENSNVTTCDSERKQPPSPAALGPHLSIPAQPPTLLLSCSSFSIDRTFTVSIYQNPRASYLAPEQPLSLD